jgi:hypothetical protein
VKANKAADAARAEETFPEVSFSHRFLPSDFSFEAPTVDLDNLESLVTTRKYLPLARRLINETRSSVTFSFAEIEKIIGEPLPNSARRYRAWWANESQTGHVQALGWMTIGWRVAEVDFGNECVVFRRA